MINNESKKIMAENIERLMNRKGVSNQQLCDDLNIKYTTFLDWKKGVTYPRIGKVELLANYFGVKKSDLIEKRWFEDEPEEQAIFEARLLRDEETMKMIRQYYKLDEKNKRAIQQMIETLSAE